jgi:hypothetical protein
VTQTIQTDSKSQDWEGGTAASGWCVQTSDCPMRFRKVRPGDGKLPFALVLENGELAPDVGRRDQPCHFLKADLAHDHAGGRGCAPLPVVHDESPNRTFALGPESTP